MTRRLIALSALAALAIGCGSPLENAVGSLVEQARLDDPQVSATYSDNRELLESVEAIPLWIDTLENDESGKVKRWAATILGNIRDPSALPALADAMSAGDRDVREACVNAIKQFDAAQASGAFVRVLETGSRDATAVALGEMSRLEAHDPKAVGAVSAVAMAGDELVGNTAVNTLGDIGGDAAVDALGEIVGDSGVPMRVRSHALDILSRTDSPMVAGKLEELVERLGNEEGTEELVAKARELS